MVDQPWPGDAVSLVEEFRSGRRSPLEELDATLAAVEASTLNAVCHVDAEAARESAAAADVSLPFGGVPVGIKELDHVAGWPATEASVALADRVATYTDTKIQRIRDAGAITAVQTTSSEFGGTNQTRTLLHGATRNPWNPEMTPGGSSGGTAAGVAGGLFVIGSGGDGGGSIRIPAGFTGLFGLKSTFGRIPKGPHHVIGNMTAVPGCLSRSVRDTARWFDVSNGYDRHDPTSLPRVDGWERGLGTLTDQLRGLRVTVDPTLGGAVVADETIELVIEAAERLISVTGLRRVEEPVRIPEVTGAWSISGVVGLRLTLGDRWPERAGDLTPGLARGLEYAEEHFDLDAQVRFERRRTELFEAMAELFERVDLVIAATNPHTAFEADGRLPTRFGGKEAKVGNNGALTIPANIYGSPAVSIPIGLDSRGLPVGMQVLAPHYREQELLELAHVFEKHYPWPLVAPAASA